MAEGGGIAGLMALFSDTNTLEVPDFQRNYSWGEDQIDEFHKDITFATKHKIDHFLGSVILMRSSVHVCGTRSRQGDGSTLARDSTSG